MVAAQLWMSFALTSWGKDLLLHGTYLVPRNRKLYALPDGVGVNRRYILQHYPNVARREVVVARLGVDIPEVRRPGKPKRGTDSFTILAVGGHPVQ